MPPHLQGRYPMKMIYALLIMVAFAVPCLAAGSGSGGTAFALYSASSAAVKTSAAFDVRGYKTKTLTVSGATLTSNASSLTFKNMSGTAIVQCAPSTNGPWSTCTQAQVASAPTVSLTANNQLTWSDAVSYVRFKWTASTTGQKVKAFLNWVEN